MNQLKAHLKQLSSLFFELIKQHALTLTVLFIACSYFCHRLYGVLFPFEVDIFQNIYFRYHADLLSKDHNPHQWYYSSFLQFSGRFNPFTLLSAQLVGLFFSSISKPGQALLTNMASSWMGLFALSLSSYFFFIALGFRKISSLAASCLITFSGFHLLGVRQFNHMYQLSMIAIGPVIYSFLKLNSPKNTHRLYWASFGAFWVGFSLLSGSNTPLFYYLPFLFLLPLFRKDIRKHLPTLFDIWGWQAGTVLVGIIAASVVIVPGIAFLDLTNRGDLFFDSLYYSTPLEMLLSMLFREFWLNRHFPYYVIDFYLTAPAFILVLYGLKSFFKEKSPLSYFWMVCLVVGFAIMNFSLLPEFIQEAIRWFYKQLSIRRPHRFYLLMLFPLGYLLARGIEQTRKSWSIFAIAFPTTIVLYFFIVQPNWDLLFAHLRSSLMFSMSFSLIGCLCIALLIKEDNIKRTKGKNTKKLQATLVASIFFALCLGHTQTTQFTPENFVKPKNIPFSFLETLGWGMNYSKSIKEAESLLTQPNSLLADPKTSRGRVFIKQNIRNRNHSYYAPETGHEFVFSRTKDPAGSHLMDSLLEVSLVNQSVLDIMGICWIIENNQLYSVTPCRSEVLLMPSLTQFKSDTEVLKWMETATPEQLLTQMPVNCQEFDCPMQQRNSRWISSSDTLTLRDKSAGYFKVETELSEPAHLFLSTHYRFDWKAYVNGVEKPIYRTHHAFMGVALDAGKHIVEITLDPWVQRYSLIASLLVFMALLITLFWTSISILSTTEDA